MGERERQARPGGEYLEVTVSTLRVLDSVFMNVKTISQNCLGIGYLEKKVLSGVDSITATSFWDCFPRNQCWNKVSFSSCNGISPPPPEESGHPAHEDSFPFPSQTLTVHVQLLSSGGLV